MHCVRIKFAKTGGAKYISHLDLTRYMSRAVRRAEIPLWYTEGFNPRPHISFALPLPLGVESFCETMDIRIEGDISNDEIKERLVAVSSPDIPIISVDEPVFDSSEIEKSTYEITFEVSQNLVDKLVSAAESGNLTAEKLSKAGKKKIMKKIDISANIFGITHDYTEGILKLGVTLSAGIRLNVSPLLFIEALGKAFEEKPEAVDIRRSALFVSDGRFFE